MSSAALLPRSIRALNLSVAQQQKWRQAEAPMAQETIRRGEWRSLREPVAPSQSRSERT